MWYLQSDIKTNEPKAGHRWIFVCEAEGRQAGSSMMNLIYYGISVIRKSFMIDAWVVTAIKGRSVGSGKHLNDLILNDSQLHQKKHSHL